jgi:F420H(2)-dependent quinone reductase
VLSKAWPHPSTTGGRNAPATRQRPDVEVEIGGKVRPIQARMATHQEATLAWAKLDRANPEYVHYRAEAHRPNPLLILEPRRT